MDELEAYPEDQTQRPVSHTEGNALGIAGFVCALVGLCAGGLLSPVGLILSLIAVGREPRGFAIAGIVLGLLGSCGFLLPIILVIVIGPAVLATLGLVGLLAYAAQYSPTVGSHLEMVHLNHLIAEYQDANGSLPRSLSDLTVSAPDVFIDHWGNEYVFELVSGDPGYRLRSAGPDGTIDTPDDIEAEYEVRFELDDGMLRQINQHGNAQSPPSSPASPAAP